MRHASISEVLGRCLHNSYVLARRAVEPSLIPSKEQKDKNFHLAFPLGLESGNIASQAKTFMNKKRNKTLEKLHNTTNPPVKLRKEV